MSSVTQSQFITELKLRSDIVSEMTDADIASFISIALRAYSDKDPYEKVSADNAVVSGQDEYDLPANTLKITDVLDSATNEPVRFSVVDEGSGQKIKLGDKLKRSYADLLQGSFYADPVHQLSSISYSYTTFDIYYVALQTLASIKETALEVLTFYIEYLSYLKKASVLAAQMSIDGGEPVSITESDSTGSSTSVNFGSKSSSQQLREAAEERLNKFNACFEAVAYGIRG